MWIVVVNRHRVAANRKAAPGDRTPVFRIARGKHGKPHYADRVSFPQGAELVYDLDHPMPCGATVWLEAPSLVEEVARPPRMTVEPGRRAQRGAMIVDQKHALIRQVL